MSVCFRNLLYLCADLDIINIKSNTINNFIN